MRFLWWQTVDVPVGAMWAWCDAQGELVFFLIREPAQSC